MTQAQNTGHFMKIPYIFGNILFISKIKLKNMKIRKYIIIVASFLLMAGCTASGAKYSEIKTSIPYVEQNKGRVYFYRPYITGVVARHKITINKNTPSERVYKLPAKGFFFVDVKPGKYNVYFNRIKGGIFLEEITDTTKRNGVFKQGKMFDVEPEQTIYVQTGLTKLETLTAIAGTRRLVRLKTKEEALPKLEKLKYIEKTI